MEKQQRNRSTLSWVTEFAGQKKANYILSVLLAVIKVICGIMPYVYMADIVDKLLKMHSGDLEKDMSLLTASIVKMAVFWLICRICHAVSTTLSHAATFEVLANIRRQLTEKLSKLPLGSVLSQSSGTYKNIICERVDSIETTLAHIIPEVLSSAFVPVSLIIYMMTINWKLTLISLVCVPVGAAFFMLMMVGSQESYNNCITKTKKLNDTAVEYINGIEVIKAFGKAKTSYEKFVIAAKEGADCFIEWMRRCNLWQNLSLLLMPYFLLGLLPFGALFYMKGSVSGSDLLMLIILSLGLVSPVMTVASYWDGISKMGTIIGEATEILEREELIRPDTMTEKPDSTDIVLNNVHFGYKDDEILHGINLNIKQGTVNALVGPSGSGKSTIAKLIASFWDVDSGSITFGGVDIRKIPLEQYNKNIAYVSQDNYLFDETIMDNIRMGDPNASDEDVMNAAKACGCHDFIMQLEHGYQTIVGGAGGHLSGGERQRISIARAMLKNAPVIILDEATAYTDPENEALVQSSVAKLVKGKTLLVIAHRLSTISSADQIILINDGKVEAVGTQQELLERSPLYTQMWNAHMTVKEGA
ncbi:MULTISPECIES: ABC transporter ATP-binding protein [Ruminococcus]|uniref:ATP-binding cassette, subfamily B n=1 Tax=Ruminococcus flavefaciens TaxID=1265 RepID=A0A1M7M1Y8_RUMFL|nr:MULTISPECIES: ABC transporter ATP-binding protein [Ruminococcus]MCR4794470.1 ABC transporter ATP-binding protein/permease [Ruminococcus sp.]SHM84692.1 ATP-binding cassette, subfamily B [Ruminococcus flavefaciens]